MKLFKFDWTQMYGNGIMIIAAKSLTAAKRLAKSNHTDWEYDQEITNLKYTGESLVPVIVLNVVYQE